MKNWLLLIFMVTTFSLSNHISGQCPVGQMDVVIEIETDSYGYEGYWQLVPAGNACGTGTIWEGGNDIQVGCSGAGEQDATTAFGYGDNISITEVVVALMKDFMISNILTTGVMALLNLMYH
jgi:hypothetical protein